MNSLEMDKFYAIWVFSTLGLLIVNQGFVFQVVSLNNLYLSSYFDLSFWAITLLCN